MLSFVYHILFIHSLSGGHLGGFRLLALVNNTAMSIDVVVFFFLHSLSSIYLLSLCHMPKLEAVEMLPHWKTPTKEL